MKVDSDLNIYQNLKEIQSYYRFFDRLTQRLTKNNHTYIRQIVDTEDLLNLSDARKKMYQEYEEDHFKKLYKTNIYIDDLDLKSYLFALFYKGKIIGTQRATPLYFETLNYIKKDKLSNFLGENFEDEYVEFTRLLVKKNSEIKNISIALNFVSGSLIALSSNKKNYFTYSNPKLKRRNLSLNDEILRFNIKERENREYEVFKGSITKDIRRVFSIKGDSHSHVIDNFKSHIMESLKENRVTHSE